MAVVQFRFSSASCFYIRRNITWVVARPCDKAAIALRHRGQPTGRHFRRPAFLRWAGLLVTAELPISEGLPGGRVRPKLHRGHSDLHPSAKLPGDFRTEPDSVLML